MLQEVSVHQLGRLLPLHYRDSLDDVVVGEESQNGSFLLNIPDYYALVIRTGNDCLTIVRYSDTTDPALVTRPGAFAVPGLGIP